MSNRYHVNPDTGRVNVCRATVKACPVGGEHYDSKESAYAGREAKLEQEHGSLATMSRKSKEDFAIDEVVRLNGDYYDTTGGEATVIKVTADSVRLKSYEDGEEYEVSRADLSNPKSQFFVGRKDKKGFLAPKPEKMRVDDDWTRIPGEGRFKSIRDGKGEARASIQMRDSFYILGARNAETKKLIDFDQTFFETAGDAADYFTKWSSRTTEVTTA